jgi:hypothetical protein
MSETKQDPTGPRPAPCTDPTNPCRQEAAGQFMAAEAANERRQDEPGMTDRDRALRDPGREVPA